LVFIFVLNLLNSFSLGEELGTLRESVYLKHHRIV